MTVAIIDYGSGNVCSVANAFETVAKSTKVQITNNLNEIRSANHLVLPGVGSFLDCMNGLKKIEGLIAEIRRQVLIEKKPFLGICVGMQVMASIGYENGEHQGLGFINGKVEKIQPAEDLKIPHMGWNDLNVEQNNCSALKDLKTGDHAYFANSYHFICNNTNNVVAHVEYGKKMTAILNKENILAVQFHPEKSGEVGLSLLKNFIDWRP
jgi:glutamine amidotransferase